LKILRISDFYVNQILRLTNMRKRDEKYTKFYLEITKREIIRVRRRKEGG